MNRANDNAYPVDSLALTPNGTVQMGLTIREHFAGLAMQGLLASGANEAHANYEWLANRAVTCADLLITELAKVKP